jgi:hypothetical protein
MRILRAEGVAISLLNVLLALQFGDSHLTL